MDEGFTNLDVSNDANSMIRKLQANRISLMVNENMTLAEQLKPSGAKVEDLKLVYTFMVSQTYLAFSQDTPDELIQQWQATLDEMKADGTFAKIYEKWLPGETPPQ
jgi:polar amino acid transport system substrate-binding protein